MLVRIDSTYCGQTALSSALHATALTRSAYRTTFKPSHPPAISSLPSCCRPQVGLGLGFWALLSDSHMRKAAVKLVRPSGRLAGGVRG